MSQRRPRSCTPVAFAVTPPAFRSSWTPNCHRRHHPSPSRLPRAHPTRRQPPICKGDDLDRAVASGVADAFDRDYYDALKAEFADVPNVTILSRDDYELDEPATNWLTEFRGVDESAIHALNARRPIPDGMAFAPLEISDLHDPEADAAFVACAAEYDPVSGAEWDDPPPDMHLVEERPFSHFRHDLPGDPPPGASDEMPEGLAFEPRRRENMSDEEEADALRASFDRLQAAEGLMGGRDLFAASHERVSQPTADEFARWTAAAEARGGNSSAHDSFELSPVAPAKPAPARPPRAPEVANQFEATARAHGGRWEGSLDVLALSFIAGRATATRTGTARVESVIGIFEDLGAFSWSSTVTPSAGGGAVSSSVRFAQRSGAEGLTPGRAVFASGEFVSARREDADVKAFSLSEETIATLTDGADGVLELCMLAGSGSRAARSRFILCCSPPAKAPNSARGGRRRSAPFTHVLHIRDARLPRGLPITAEGPFSPDALLGRWRGSGTSLHPEYPLAPSANVESTMHSRTVGGVRPEDVSWTEEDFSQMHSEGQSGKRAAGKSLHVSGSKNKRRSKRVVAAVAHDARRLAACDRLCTSSVGSAGEETYAWRWEEEAGVQCGYSPRVGRFVGDYFSIALPGGFVLSAPAGPAWPRIHNEVAVVEALRPRRNRLTVARSAAGDLVGVALLSENLEDNDVEDA